MFDDDLRMTLAPDLDEIDRLTEEIHKFGDARFPEHVLDALDLIVDELLTNTIRYGFADGRDGKVRVLLFEEDGRAVLEIKDDGVPFDPLSRPAPDLNADLEAREIGGWGVHLVRQSTDRLIYEHRDGMNCLRAEIRCDADPFAAFADEEEEEEEDEEDPDDAADDAVDAEAAEDGDASPDEDGNEDEDEDASAATPDADALPVDAQPLAPPSLDAEAPGADDAAAPSLAAVTADPARTPCLSVLSLFSSRQNQS